VYVQAVKSPMPTVSNVMSRTVFKPVARKQTVAILRSVSNDERDEPRTETNQFHIDHYMNGEVSSVRGIGTSRLEQCSRQEEVDDSLSCTETLLLSCESEVFSPNVESVLNNSNTLTELVATSTPKRSIIVFKDDANNVSNVTEVKEDTTLQSNVTAILLKSVAHISFGDKVPNEKKDVRSVAASLLDRNHCRSSTSTLSSITTILKRPASREGSFVHFFDVCEDVIELEKLLDESEKIKHKLTEQLNAERKYSASLSTWIGKLEAVAFKLKEKLASVDPDGYMQFVNGSSCSLYR